MQIHNLPISSELCELVDVYAVRWGYSRSETLRALALAGILDDGIRHPEDLEVCGEPPERGVCRKNISVCLPDEVFEVVHVAGDQAATSHRVGQLIESTLIKLEQALLD